MSAQNPAGPEVFTVREIARAAGAATADVRALLDGVATFHGGFIAADDAVRLVRGLRGLADEHPQQRRLFTPPHHGSRRPAMPAAASGALHVGILAAMILLSGLGLRSEVTEQRIPEPVRLVFLATPGPGGGGGGGGLRQPLPPAKAELKGTSKLRSPVTVTKPVERREPEKRVETPPPALPEPRPNPPPPEPKPEIAPPVVAPVVSAPPDAADRTGVATDTHATAPSNGPGTGGGSGTGTGTGMGEGNGAGVGDGSIAGVGGGPYRPGTGITPPGLLREVKPVYTEEGRRRGVEGDVVLEVVVRADGSVGAMRILRGLGAGLDQRATDAVRQWRFSPARRFGTPVDVLVEVAVEFRLR
jgi:periplasmic protein TonB